MASQTIALKTVLHEINEPGNIFSLTFRTLSGDLSVKSQVKKNPTKAKAPASEAGTDPATKTDLKSIQRQLNYTASLLLYDCIQRHPFEVKIDLLVSYNGYTIFHNY